jgi:hypothetical protein
LMHCDSLYDFCNGGLARGKPKLARLHKRFENLVTGRTSPCSPMEVVPRLAVVDACAPRRKQGEKEPTVLMRQRGVRPLKSSLQLESESPLPSPPPILRQVQKKLSTCSTWFRWPVGNGPSGLK